MFDIDLLSGRVPVRPRRAIEKLSDTVIERLGEATPDKSGLMSPEDKEKLDGLGNIPEATTESAGLMSSEDKTKLETPGLKNFLAYIKEFYNWRNGSHTVYLREYGGLIYPEFLGNLIHSGIVSFFRIENPYNVGASNIVIDMSSFMPGLLVNEVSAFPYFISIENRTECSILLPNYSFGADDRGVSLYFGGAALEILPMSKVQFVLFRIDDYIIIPIKNETVLL